MRNITFVYLFFCAATAGLAQATFTPISNLNQPSAGTWGGIVSGAGLAISFTTGNTAASLSSASVAIASSGSSFHTNDVFGLSIYNDAAGKPGTRLAILSGNNFPTNSGIYTYTDTNASPLVLSTDTTYWLVATNSGPDDPYSIDIPDSTNLDAGSVWTLGAVEVFPNWLVLAGYHLEFSVTVTNSIAPAISISQPIVLMYPTPDFNFVLQQNSDLANTTNWTAATNAVLSGVISNQTVFIVPSGGQRMFYRLNFQ